MTQMSESPRRAATLAVNGVNYYYAVYGKGEPLLLLHGGLGQIEMFGPNLGRWRRTAKSSASTCTATAARISAIARSA